MGDEKLKEDDEDYGDMDAFAAGAAESEEAERNRSAGDCEHPRGPHGMAESDQHKDRGGGVCEDEFFAAARESEEHRVDESGRGNARGKHDEDVPAENDDSPEECRSHRELECDVEFTARDGPD